MKKTFTLLIAFCLLTIFVSCGGKNDGNVSSEYSENIMETSIENSNGNSNTDNISNSETIDSETSYVETNSKMDNSSEYSENAVETSIESSNNNTSNLNNSETSYEDTNSKTDTSSISETQIIVPNVVGLKSTEAISHLQTLGFTVAVKQQINDSKNAGIILAQSINANKKVNKNTTIELTVCINSNLITVPNVVGKTVANAERELKNFGLSVQIKEINSETVGKGIVILQGTVSNAKVAKGSIIIITVSKGPIVNNGSNPDGIIILKSNKYDIPEDAYIFTNHDWEKTDFLEFAEFSPFNTSKHPDPTINRNLKEKIFSEWPAEFLPKSLPKFPNGAEILDCRQLNNGVYITVVLSFADAGNYRNYLENAGFTEVSSMGYTPYYFNDNNDLIYNHSYYNNYAKYAGNNFLENIDKIFFITDFLIIKNYK